MTRSRRAILEAATALFLEQGYVATTMDDIAARAGVSKRTVYNHVPDKDALFREVVLTATALADTFVAEAADLLDAPDDLDATLVEVARRLAVIATGPSVIRLRRLIIGEAHRVPDLADDYFERAPGKVLEMLAAAFAELAARGRLRAPDPERAAEQYAYLVVGASLDRALFSGDPRHAPDPAAIAATATAGVTTFLAAHRPGREEDPSAPRRRRPGRAPGPEARD